MTMSCFECTIHMKGSKRSFLIELLSLKLLFGFLRSGFHLNLLMEHALYRKNYNAIRTAAGIPCLIRCLLLRQSGSLSC